MKIERFIKEYANYKINDLKSNLLMRENFKMDKIERINKALILRENGLITIDESMKIIAKQ